MSDELIFNLDAEMTDTELLQLGEAVKGASKLRKALDKVISALKDNDAKAAIDALKAAIDSIESYGYAYGYPEPKEAAKGMDSSKAIKLIKGAISALEKKEPDFDGAMDKMGDLMEMLGYPKPERESSEPELKEAKFAESMGGVISIGEGKADFAERQGPVSLDVAIIEPGWGNDSDKNFYPAEVLRRDANKFIGAKMFETDHKDEEKNTKTWVSTIIGVPGFTETGAPMGRVLVHDPNFAERILNLDEAGLLDKMECSIYATGTASEGSVNGVDGNIVNEISEVSSVDWVSRAGAGGRVMNLAESNEQQVEEQITEEQEEVIVKESPVKDLLGQTVNSRLYSYQLGELAFTTLEMLGKACREQDEEKALEILDGFKEVATELIQKIISENSFSDLSLNAAFQEHVELQEGRLSKARAEHFDGIVGNLVEAALALRRILQDPSVADDEIAERVAQKVQEAGSESVQELRREIDEAKSRKQGDIDKLVNILASESEREQPSDGGNGKGVIEEIKLTPEEQYQFTMKRFKESVK